MFSRIVLALALIAGASAFTPASFGARARTALNANIIDTASTLTGPNVPWGSEGVLQGFEESDIKGTDDCKKFVQACQATGIAQVLSGPGPFTVFVPVDSAFDGVDMSNTAALENILKYHIHQGQLAKGSIGSDVQTMAGKALTYKRFARQTFMDDAVIGIVPQGAATGEPYPCDIQCDNGVIHTIDRVLNPAWTPVGEEVGLGGVV